MAHPRPLRTYSRARRPVSPRRSDAIEGLRKSLAEVERRILVDISNTQTTRASRLSAVSLQSPSAAYRLPETIPPVSSSGDTPLAIAEHNTTSPASEIPIYEDKKDEGSALRPRRRMPKSGALVPLDNPWSPGEVLGRIPRGTAPEKAALGGQIGPAGKISRPPLPPRISRPIDFEVPPEALDDVVWVRENDAPLPKTDLPDHFLPL